MTFSRGRPRRRGADLEPVREIVSERVWSAMEDASRLLRELGIQHALVGGLAVGAHGWPRATKGVEFLLKLALQTPETSQGVPIAPVEALVYLKLASPRSKDRLDVVELVRAGMDRERVRSYLEDHASHLLEKLEDCLREADAEEG